MLEALLLVIPVVCIMFFGGNPVTQWVAIAALVVCMPGFLVMTGGAPFVATPKKIMEGMLRLAKIKPGERVVDAGCGDGRLVLSAAAAGAFATGYEMSVPTFLVAKLRTLFKKNTRIEFKNFWHQDYKNVDVVFCYLLRDTTIRFQRDIWPTLKPGARVVSHAFRFKDMQPDGEDAGAVLYIKKA